MAIYSSTSSDLSRSSLSSNIAFSQKIIVSFLVLSIAVVASRCKSEDLLTDGFDSLANWNVIAQNDTSTNIIDYSSLGIPEAPNHIPGSQSTTGVRFTANTSAGAATAVNLIGKVSGANADLSLSDYQLQFDVWLSVDSPLLPSGSTEQVLWGVGRTTNVAIGRNNRTSDGDGVFGWLATENGYGTTDTAVYAGTAEADRRNDSDDAALFDAAFSPFAFPGGNAAAPANHWVTVTVSVDGGQVATFYDGIHFLTAPAGQTVGDIMVGYEDPFSSISSSPVNQFGIIDNIVIDDKTFSGMGFADAYSPSNWTRTSTDETAAVYTGNAPEEITVFGSEELDGSFVDYTTVAVADGTISFSWNVEKFGFDFGSNIEAGFFLKNGVPEELDFFDGDTYFSAGFFSDSVEAGDVIGFRVADEFAGLNIFNFAAPDAQGLSGDFDDDTDVDGNDFLGWQRGVVSTPPTSGDLLDWQTNYGTSSPLAASLESVPEPTGAVMAIGCLAVAFAQRGGTRKA